MLQTDIYISFYSQHIIFISTALALAADHPYMSRSYIFETNLGKFGLTRDPTRSAKIA